MDLFTIICVTCQARLKVRDASAIGRIVACPKCGSMVQVRAPAGWQPAAARITPPPSAAQRGAAGPEEPPKIRPAPAAPRLPRARRISAEEMALLLRDTQPISDAGIDLESIGEDDLQVAPPPPDAVRPPPVEPREVQPTLAAVERRGWRPSLWTRWALWGGLTAGVAALVMAICLAVAWPPAPETVTLTGNAQPLASVNAPAIDRVPLDVLPAGDDEESPVVSRAFPPVADARPILQGDARQALQDAAFDPASVLEEFARGMERRLARSDAEEVLSEAEAVANVPAENAAGEAAVAPRVAPPKAIDVAARLADRLRLTVQEMPLAVYYRTLAEIGAVPVSLDLDALALAGVSPRQPVSLNLEAATLAEALAAPVEQYGLGAAMDDFGVTITAAVGADGPAIARHAVGDLLPGGTPEDVRQLVLRLVAPATWSEVGGPGTIQVEAAELVVEHAAGARVETLRFLERLRLARGPQLGAAVTPLTTRWQLAHDRLTAPQTANFVEPTRLSRIVTHLEAKTGLTICVDWTSLAEQGIGAEAAMTFHATDTPVWEALASLLAPLGLSVRIVDEQTLEIVGRGREESAAYVEFYPVRALSGSSSSAAALLKRIETEISPESWQAAGGGGTLYYDAPSGYLLVRQSSAVHVELERLLETLPPAAAP